MHRVRVAAVGNTKAQADGKWLNIIGNKAIATGDYVWTDGRCIYGNISEGGGAAPIINTSEPYVPIFMKDGKHCLYHKGKLKVGWQDSSHELMVSRGSDVLFSDYYRALDVSISQSGEVQELITEKYVYGHGTTGYSFHDYQDSRGAKVGIYFDGDEREFYWRDGLIADMKKLHFIPALKEGNQMAGEYAMAELTRQAPVGSAGSYTVLPYSECRIKRGWYESKQDYCFILEGNARAIYMTGSNLCVSADSRQCWEADYGTLDFWEVEYLLELMATPAGITILRGRFNNNTNLALTYLPLDEEYDEPYHFVDFSESTDILLPDGFRVTMSRSNKKRISYMGYEPDSYRYGLKSPQGQRICDIGGYEPGNRLLACKLRPRTWLVAWAGKLYRVKNGEKKLIEGDYYHRNSRLRPMKNYAKWMKGE